METWKLASGFGDRLAVSTRGGVMARGRDGEWTRCRLEVKPSGHLRVSLRVDGRQVRKHLHRIVAEEFISNPQGLPLVLHWDDNPANNAVENLRWGTYSDNSSDRARNGIPMNWQSKATHCIHGHEFTDENTLRDRSGSRHCKTCRRSRGRARSAA